MYSKEKLKTLKACLQERFSDRFAIRSWMLAKNHYISEFCEDLNVKTPAQAVRANQVELVFKALQWSRTRRKALPPWEGLDQYITREFRIDLRRDRITPRIFRFGTRVWIDKQESVAV